jgi:hypothetical protein
MAVQAISPMAVQAISPQHAPIVDLKHVPRRETCMLQSTLYGTVT